MALRIPARPDDVDPAWLSDALRASGDLPEGRVVDFETSPVGTGQVGQNIRFSLRFEGAPPGAPTSVVGKFASDDEQSRATGVTQQNYWKEVRFYNELAPTVGIQTPRCLFAAAKAIDSAEFVILMEDLAPAEQGDQIRGCTPDEAALALEELAKLHAPRFGDRSLAELDWIGHPSEQNDQILAALYGTFYAGFAERYADRLAPEALDAARRFGDGILHWSAGHQGPTAVTHGDYRLDNMLFGTREGGYPLAVVDWQTPAEGYPVGDASYFLGAGLLPEDRRKDERALLKLYHDHLRAGGVTDFSFERCFEDYRRFAWNGVIMAVVASMIVGQSERGDEMFLAMASRHAAHALELDAFDFLG